MSEWHPLSLVLANLSAFARVTSLYISVSSNRLVCVKSCVLLSFSFTKWIWYVPLSFHVYLSVYIRSNLPYFSFFFKLTSICQNYAPFQLFLCANFASVMWLVTQFWMDRVVCSLLGWMSTSRSFSNFNAIFTRCCVFILPLQCLSSFVL